MSLLRSLRRVASWRLHKIGDLLDPMGSYYQPVRDLDKDDRDWILQIIKDYQPVPWAQMLVWSGMNAKQTRENVQDLIDERLVEVTSKGLIIGLKEDNA